MSEEKKDFKVVDKRHSASSGSEKKDNEARGDGFVMKEGPKEQARTIDQIDFSTFIYSLATGALIHLGLAPDPTTGKTEKDCQLAKQDIDLLELIEEKTKGNLTQEEKQLLAGLLTEVRLRYVEAKK